MIDILWRHSGGPNLMGHERDGGHRGRGADRRVGSDLADRGWEISTRTRRCRCPLALQWFQQVARRLVPERDGYLGVRDLFPVADLSWRIAGTGDYNNDGNVDILWRYYGPGGFNSIWSWTGRTPLEEERSSPWPTGFGGRQPTEGFEASFSVAPSMRRRVCCVLP